MFWTATTELSRQVPRLRRGLRAVLRPALHVRAAAAGPRVGAGLPRRRRARRRTRFYLLENRFQAGGPTTVRGFRQNDLGPQIDAGRGLRRPGRLRLQPGAALPDLEAAVTGGVFWDAGNVVGALARRLARGPAPERRRRPARSCSRSGRSGSSTRSSSSRATGRAARAASCSASATRSSLGRTSSAATCRGPVERIRSVERGPVSTARPCTGRRRQASRARTARSPGGRRVARPRGLDEAVGPQGVELRPDVEAAAAVPRREARQVAPRDAALLALHGVGDDVQRVRETSAPGAPCRCRGTSREPRPTSR